MFNSHLVKVIIGFCGVIVLGLIILVVIDSYKSHTDTANITPAVQATDLQKTQSKSVVLPPINKSKTVCANGKTGNC